ncbi:MAG: cupin domain-containing protein, partial [Nitrososphaerales archaeon]
KKKGRVLERYTYISKSNLGRVPKFSAGVSILSKNFASTLSGSKQEFAREKACIIASGKMSVKWNNKKESLGPNDCLYIPSHTEYEIANLGDDELSFAWTISPSFDENLPKEVKRENSKGEVRVIRTLKDVRPIVLAAKGMERSIYPISQTRGFHFALFLRGPSTYAPLHTHLPRDFEEAFIVLDGKLKVSGINGESFNLKQFDCAYVPPFGGNMNENTSSKTVMYLWMGSPPVNVKEIPVEKKYSNYEKVLAVDK